MHSHPDTDTDMHRQTLHSNSESDCPGLTAAHIPARTVTRVTRLKTNTRKITSHHNTKEICQLVSGISQAYATTAIRPRLQLPHLHDTAHPLCCAAPTHMPAPFLLSPDPQD